MKVKIDTDIRTFFKKNIINNINTQGYIAMAQQLVDCYRDTYYSIYAVDIYETDKESKEYVRHMITLSEYITELIIDKELIEIYYILPNGKQNYVYMSKDTKITVKGYNVSSNDKNQAVKLLQDMYDKEEKEIYEMSKQKREKTIEELYENISRRKQHSSSQQKRKDNPDDPSKKD